MKERIILAPGANGTELTKCLAVRGVNCINIRVMRATELARVALMRSGVSLNNELVSRSEETTLISQAVSGVNYFARSTYSDIREITSAIRRMRTLVTDDEQKAISDILKKGIFAEKNEALLSVYEKYIKSIELSGLLDTVGLIRKAISEAEVMDSEFVVLDEYPLTPLEEKLLNKVSGGNVTRCSLKDLFKADNRQVAIQRYMNCYGAPNEVEMIINHIYKGDGIDKCTVAVTDVATYGQLFFDYALLYDMPVTFGCGIPVINSNPAKLLSLYYNWLTGGFFGIDAIKAMISSEAFDRKKLKEGFTEVDESFNYGTFYDVLYAIRFTNNAEVNSARLKDYKDAIAEEEKTIATDSKDYKYFLRRKACIPYLEYMASELSLPAEEFILKYSRIRKGSKSNADRLIMNLDMAARNAIYDELKVIGSSGIEQAKEDIIVNVLKMNVAASGSEEGKLYVTTVNGAINTIRDNIYIAGMSASKFPGSPKENYLLLDKDLELFGEGGISFTSDNRIKLKRMQLLNLVRLASSLECKINISYSGLNVAELKNDNASSLIFELYREEKGSNATTKDLEEKVERIDYFEPAISVSRLIGDEYNHGKQVLTDCHDEDENDNKKGNQSENQEADANDPYANLEKITVGLEKVFAPSALNDYVECPFRFMLAHILMLPHDEENDPFETISAAAVGTLAHSLMEILANSLITKDEFLTMADNYFNRYIKENPPLIPGKIEKERSQFLEMMEIAYESDSHREVPLKEEDIEAEHESGIKLHGFPDRVEKLADGKYIIVDYKTGRRIKHVRDDIYSCLQIVIYAYLMEQKGYNISGGEYRYIRLGEVVTCKYDDEMKDKLKAFLNDVKKSLKYGFFLRATDTIEGDGDEVCKYCPYKKICNQ